MDANRDRQYDLNEIADGLRSGNAHFVQGDLIDHLEFEAQDGSRKAVMGEELRSNRGAIANLKLKIKFKSPSTNNCTEDGTYITSCAAPVVDHIDLIAGEITGKIEPTDPNYTNATNPTTKVIASFSRPDFTVDKDGYHTIVYHLKNVSKNTYFRLRGTNLACNTPYETGPANLLPAADYCSPLADALVTQNLGIDGAQEAWDDLWFYSNPIFVYVK